LFDYVLFFYCLSFKASAKIGNDFFMRNTFFKKIAKKYPNAYPTPHLFPDIVEKD